MAYRAGWSNQTEATSLAIATSAVAGDCLIAWVITDTVPDATVTWPSGFTQLAATWGAYDTGTLLAAIKPVASGSEGTLTLTLSHAGIGGIAAFSGRHATQPDVTTVTARKGSGQASPWSHTASITPVADGCDIVAVMLSDVGASAADATHTFADTTSGSWTVHQDLCSAAAGNWIQGALASRPQTTAGSIGTLTFTGTAASTTAEPAAILIALSPAEGITGTQDATLGPMTSAGTGTVDVVGTQAATLGPMTSAGTGTVDVVGAQAATLGPMTSSGTAEVSGEGTAPSASPAASGGGWAITVLDEEEEEELETISVIIDGDPLDLTHDALIADVQEMARWDAVLYKRSGTSEHVNTYVRTALKDFGERLVMDDEVLFADLRYLYATRLSEFIRGVA